MKKQNTIPLVQALAWIVGSAFLISGSAYAGLKWYLNHHRHNRWDPRFTLRSIIQTGPQKEALKTTYLAELLDISSDRWISTQGYDVKSAQNKLLCSPLISHAEVKIVKPSSIYIDYTIRQPVAYLEDYTNIAIDKEGYPFPFTPFFSPKNLPRIYFGLSKFGFPAIDPSKPLVKWGSPCQGKYMELARHILNLVTDPKVEDCFSVQRIDVSNAFADSYGTREIVLITEDILTKQTQGKEVHLCLPRILRLSTKFYAQELANYLTLRKQMLDEERKTLLVPEEREGFFRCKNKIIDFRLPKLAFIEEN